MPVVQTIRLTMNALSQLEFDGTNRAFECPVGYTDKCDCDNSTCVYYSKRNHDTGTCAVPFMFGFKMGIA